MSSVLLVSSLALPQSTGVASGQGIHLTVAAGVPLRLYVTRRFSKKKNAPVVAKLLTPVYAFDRVVIPASATVQGHVSALHPVSKWERAHAILNGDFTPLHVAAIEFTSLIMPSGITIPIHTSASSGLNTLVPTVPPYQRQQASSNNSSGLFAKGKQQVKDQISAGLAQVRSIPSVVRTTDKKEWLYDFAMSKLPYHPQYVRGRTRFDAELAEPLDFGSATLPGDSLALLGTQAAADAVVHARILTPLSSKVATPGQKVEAVLEQPLFSGNHELVLPEGARLDGSVAVAKPAGWFHHGGRLRFRFQDVDLSAVLAQITKPSPGSEGLLGAERSSQFSTQGRVTAAESGKSPLKVDQEGEVQAKDSNTRFIGTAVSALIARSAADNDPIRNSKGTITGTSSNIGGRTLGGGSGFGLLGAIASQSSRNVGTAFGYYGLAWSVYSTVIARGSEVQFDKNSVVDIGFSGRAAQAQLKHRSAP